jgi:hypothetical protein
MVCPPATSEAGILSAKVVSCSNINGYLQNYQDCLTLPAALMIERTFTTHLFPYFRTNQTEENAVHNRKILFDFLLHTEFKIHHVIQFSFEQSGYYI